MKLVPATLALLLAGSLSAMAHDIPAEVGKSPPAGAFKAVSSLVKLPDFLPGMGQPFVDPATLPAGPFVAYDHDGKLVSTVYMLPTKDPQSGQALRGHWFSIWLTRIALNEALGRYVGASPASPSAIDAEVISQGGSVVISPTSLTPSGADSELGRRQIRDFLEQAVDELPESFRLVFILRDIEEMSTEETAEQLSLRPETVKTRLHRARRLLRTAIETRLSPTFSGLFRSTAHAATAWPTGSSRDCVALARRKTLTGSLWFSACVIYRHPHGVSGAANCRSASDACSRPPNPASQADGIFSTAG